jgi:hypothetical protein
MRAEMWEGRREEIMLGNGKMEVPFIETEKTVHRSNLGDWKGDNEHSLGQYVFEITV